MAAFLRPQPTFLRHERQHSSFTATPKATHPYLGSLRYASLWARGIRRIGCSHQKCSFNTAVSTLSEVEWGSYLDVQTLGDFPVEKLFGEVVLLRFDSGILVSKGLNSRNELFEKAKYTVTYLCSAGCKLVLASSWGKDSTGNYLSPQFVADRLSSFLEIKVIHSKSRLNGAVEADAILLENLSENVEEQANCSTFARQLSLGIGIFVNDSFCLSHKILSSTVGITRFCDASLAGFQYDLELSQAKEIVKKSPSPYFAIIGGGKLSDKANAVCHLASICDGLVFVGNMAFPIMKCFGVPLPQSLVEPGAVEVALKIIQLSLDRKIPIIFPKDFYCHNDFHEKRLAVVTVKELLEGWTPVDVGPSFLEEIVSLISNSKKLLWIGPVGFDSLQQQSNGTKLASIMDNTCGRTLPGIAALDKAYPFKVAWNDVFANPNLPLIVDIGSGNGLFLLQMAAAWESFNFLGLEINKKLVARCLNSLCLAGMKNGHFIATNATSTFRSIVSDYPGELVLVSILCPNPDFNKVGHRWRMLQKGLVQAVADLLVNGGKVFLQSDVEDVAERMKDQFILHGEGKFAIS